MTDTSERESSLVERLFGLSNAEDRPGRTALVVLSAFSVIGYLDFATGVELRVYPLYFWPLGYSAARSTKVWALSVGAMAAGTWAVANWAAGMTSSWVGWVNLVSQLVAFELFVLLIWSLRAQSLRERALARVDALTGLSNSRGFFELAGRELERQRRKRTVLTLAYLDLDDFKKVNDQLGHMRADELLTSVGETLRTSVRSLDVAARLGGDEFALLFPETDERQVLVVLDRIKARLSEVAAPFQCKVTFSIGAVVTKQPLRDVETLLHEADTFMYKVKRAGKDAVEIGVIGAEG